MRHTVVGLFDRRADAERASESLLRSGFDRARLHLADDKAAELLPPSTVMEGGTGIAGRPLAELFANLFGGDDQPHAAQYEEAVRRGHVVLHAEADDDRQIAAATEAMRTAGALDIDDRLGDWRQGGWDSGGTAEASQAPDPQNRLDSAATPAAGFVAVATVRKQVETSGGVRVYASTAVHGYDDYANEFRGHYESRYGTLGGAYEDYDPAYRHGHAMALDDRYRGRDWTDFESEAERDWQTRNPSSSWQKVKDAARHAWERARR